MRNSPQRIKIFDAIALLSAEFTAAITGVITSIAHGLKDGDPVRLTTTDTLPAGLSLATRYYVISATTNTFKLSTDRGCGVAVDITDTGTGTHTFTVAASSEPVLIGDFRHKKITIHMEGMGAGDTATIKAMESGQEIPPDFDATASKDNDYEYVQNVKNEDGSTVDGETGLAMSASVIKGKWAVNINGGKWFALKLTAQNDTANTSVTAYVELANN